MGFGDSTRINTNLQSLHAYASLQKTNARLGTHQLRLATGSRINSAEDDSAGYSIAKKLEAKTRGQAQALANIGDAKSMLTVAEGSLSTVMDVLQTMKEKAVQAANDSMGASERTAIQNQLAELKEEIADVLGETEFNGTRLFDAAADTALAFQVGAEKGDKFEATIQAISADALLGSSATVNNASSGAGIVEADYGSSAAAFTDWTPGTTAGVTINYTGGVDGRKYAITLDAGASAGTIDGDESLTYSYKDTDGTVVTGSIDLDLTTYQAGDVIKIGDDLEVSFDNFDSSNLADFVANEGDTFLVDADLSGTMDVSDHTKASATISLIDAAIQTVSDQLGKLGDAQSRLSFKQENLQTSMNNYEAARSRIADADFAKEQMAIVKLQILQQTGTAALAQANVAPQSILSLIGGQ